MNLTELYTEHFLPYLTNKDSAETTIAEYARTARNWDWLLESPDLADVTAEHVKRFKRELASQPGTNRGLMSSNTIRKYLTYLKPMLKMAGPRDSKNPHGLDILAVIPEMNPPAEKFRNAEDSFTREEIIAWIEAARKFRHPDIAGVQAGVWWECFLTVIYNSGLRVGTLINATWDWVDFRRMTFIPEKRQGVKTVYRTCLNDEAAAMLLRMRNAHASAKLFPWPYHRRTLYCHARRQQEMAGIPKHRQFGFHAIRKHFGSEMASYDFAAATRALGHSSPSVTSQYYLNSDIVVAPAVQRIKPIGKAAEVGNVAPCTAASPLPSLPINHIDAEPFGSIIVYR